MSDEHDHENHVGDVRYKYMQVGEVVDRVDPMKLGRVRVRIPGLIDDKSAWAFPMGAPGGGSPKRGFKWVPPLHSEVAVLFKGGDPDAPYYMPAQWGTGEMVTDAADVDSSEDVHSMEFKRYTITVDERSGKDSFVLKDKTTGDIIEFDGSPATGPGIRISGSAAVVIQTKGAFVVDALTATICGRAVTPSGKPI